MQPIFSAINDAHRGLALDPPAVDNHFLSRARRGLGRAQAAVSTRDTRIPLPPEAIISILTAAEASTAALPALRRASALTLTGLFAGRSDTSVHLRSEDVQITPDFIWLRLTEKGKRHRSVRRVVRLPLSQRAIDGVASAVPRVAALLQRYFDARDAAGRTAEFAFQLGGETRPTTTTQEQWLATELAGIGVSAPPGFAYQGHSLRSMGASCMAAIGVDRHIYIWVGGWVRGSSVVDAHYVDPTVLPTPAAYALYGWALSRQYRAEAGVIVAATVLPDPLAAPASPSTPAHVRVAARIRMLM